jgi:lysophospholipase L1-like esterase
LLSILPSIVGAAPLPVSVAADFAVRVGPGQTEVAGRPINIAVPLVLQVPPPEMATVKDEKWDRLVLFNPKGPSWAKGAVLRGVDAQECSATDMLEPSSLRVKLGPGDGQVLTPEKDYTFDPKWGSFGRLEGGAIGEATPVYADYRHGLCRIDSVVADGQGQLSVVSGKPHVNVPRPPELAAGQRRIANVWVPGRLARLTEGNLFPIEADAYPEPPPQSPTVAERLVPKTMAKLRSGGKLTILAWGDSVTVGTFVPDWQKNRWQEQFGAQLHGAFPKANIELVTVAWGGRNVQSFLHEPPGSEFNYQEKVLNRRPDLIVSEFVNDAYLDPAGVEQLYSKLLADFQGIGAEWIILTPHYVRPDWLGIPSERDCDNDPRAYTKGLREFAPKHNVALADASLRWGHLWREGIPYTTLLLNAINHPDERGMKLFADSLMALFR